jgi:hypothetical protein
MEELWKEMRLGEATLEHAAHRWWYNVEKELTLQEATPEGEEMGELWKEMSLGEATPEDSAHRWWKNFERKWV